MSDCSTCVEFIADSKDPAYNICDAIRSHRATRIDLPLEPTNPYIGPQKENCVAQVRHSLGTPDGLTGPSASVVFPAYAGTSVYARLLHTILGR